MYDLFSNPPDTGSGAGPATIEPRADAARLFQNAVILQLELSRLGVRRKVSSEAVTSAAAPELLHVSKSILDSDELKAIGSAHSDMRKFVAGRASGPAFLNRGGFHLLALALVQSTDAELERRTAEIADLVERFLLVYEQRAAETRARLGSLAPGADEYPPLDVVRRAFGVRWRYLSFETPSTLQGIKREIFDCEREKAAAEWSAALDECKQVLRSAFADLVEHLADRLAADDGKPRKFKDSLVKNFDEFAATFAARNIADDRELADLVERARGVMAGVSAKDLRTEEALRAAVARSMADLKRDIEPLIVDRPSRMYSDE
jgi:hypothetical protein